MSTQPLLEHSAAAGAQTDCSAGSQLTDDALTIEDMITDLLCCNASLVQEFSQNINEASLVIYVDADGIRALECMLLGVVSMIASEVSRPERILPSVHALAVAHLGSNFNALQLKLIAAAFYRAAKAELGDRFSPSREMAWCRVVEMLIARLGGGRPV